MGKRSSGRNSFISNHSVAATMNILLLLSLALSLVVPSTVFAKEDKWKPKIDMDKSQSELFEIAHEIAVNSPSAFPKPTFLLNDPEAVVVVEPTIGKHRPDQDVVMAYAEGYTVDYYMSFIETLRATGFDGDIVLATSEHKFLQPYVLEYLESQENVVVYIHQLDCFEKDSVTPARRKYSRGSPDVFQMCLFNDVYGRKDADGKVTQTAKDPRMGRAVATLRYEWYWIWAQHYNPNSWIMLVDARDAFFQTNPFVNLPRNQNGLLYFFGENADATRIGISRKNRNWILRGYGQEVLDALKDKPTICSGSTMGEQLAIETYLRALVNEWDETDIKMTGSDQGFHNYLYYSGKLANSATISKLVVWEQGKGIINNLGALRTKQFWEWGFYNNRTKEVYNWDGTLSPVAHQWDRDKDLHTYMQQVKFKKWKKSFMEQSKANEKARAKEGNLRAN